MKSIFLLVSLSIASLAFAENKVIFEHCVPFAKNAPTSKFCYRLNSEDLDEAWLENSDGSRIELHRGKFNFVPKISENAPSIPGVILKSLNFGSTNQVEWIFFEDKGDIHLVSSKGQTVRLPDSKKIGTYFTPFSKIPGYTIIQTTRESAEGSIWEEIYILRSSDGMVAQLPASRAKAGAAVTSNNPFAADLVLDNDVPTLLREGQVKIPLDELIYSKQISVNLPLREVTGGAHFVDLGKGRFIQIADPEIFRAEAYWTRSIRYKEDTYHIVNIAKTKTTSIYRTYVIRESDGMTLRTYGESRGALLQAKIPKLDENGILDLGVEKKFDLNNFSTLARMVPNLHNAILSSVPGPKSVLVTRVDGSFRNDVSVTPKGSGLSGFTYRNISNEVVKKLMAGSNQQLLGREQIINNIMEGLVRERNNNILLLGEAGAGKTSIVEKVAERFATGLYPDAKAFSNFGNANPIFIEVKAANFQDGNRNHAALAERMATAISEYQLNQSQPVILFIDEAHSLPPETLEVLKTYTAGGSTSFRVIMASTNTEFNTAFRSGSEAIRRRFKTVSVPDLSHEDVLMVIRDYTIPRLKAHYGSVNVAPDTIEAVAISGVEYMPGQGRLTGAERLLEDVIIREHRKSGSGPTEVSAKHVGAFIADSMHLPFNVHDEDGFNDGLEALRSKLNRDVIEQERATQVLIEVVADLFSSEDSARSIRTVLLGGSTGVGKSQLANSLAKGLFGNTDRLFTLDASTIQHASDLASYFGADKMWKDSSPGRLIEFIQGKGRGLNIIVINELEKSIPEFRSAIMEMLDTGFITGGDGRRYHMGKSIVLLTTNKGAERIYPRNQKRPMSKVELKKHLDAISENDMKNMLVASDPKDTRDTTKQIAPEFVQRIDRAVPMGPPSPEGAKEVALQYLADSKKNAKKVGYHFDIDDTVIDRIVEDYYVQEDGVRSLRSGLAGTLVRLREEIRKKYGKIPKSADGIKISLLPGKKEWQISVPGHSEPLLVQMPTPKPKFESILKTSEGRKFINEISVKAKKRVIGQDKMIDAIVTAIITRGTNSKVKTPVRFAIMGSTGTGKTEVFKALAEAEFGNEDALLHFNLGEIMDPAQIQEIFGAAQSRNPAKPKLQVWLDSHKDGGYILLDEMGNMPTELKTQLQRVIYQIMDEGIYVAPDGTRYDMKKYRIGVTSNEMQELFKSAPNDQLRLAVWQEYTSQKNVKDYLAENHKWQEAQFARYDQILLAKPLMLAERIEIAKKLVSPIVAALATDYNLKITYDENFFEVVADSFFTHEGGARDMLKLGEQAVNQIIVDMIRKMDDKADGATVELKLTDNFIGRHKFFNVYPQREVNLSATATTIDGSSETITTDVMENAKERRLAAFKDLQRTSYHEAGHIFANDPTKTGIASNYVTVIGEGNFNGYANGFKYEGAPNTMSRDQAIAKIARALGGAVAEDLLRGEHTAGWTGDLKSATGVAEYAIISARLTRNPEDAMKLPTRDGKVDAGDRLVKEEIAALLEEGRARARQMLIDAWPAVEAMARVLIVKGKMDQEMINKFLDPEQFKNYLNRRKIKGNLPAPGYLTEAEKAKIEELKGFSPGRINCLKNALNVLSRAPVRATR